MLVSSLVSVTVASGTTAPLESTTVPVRRAVVLWAKHSPATLSNMTADKKRCKSLFLFIFDSFFRFTLVACTKAVERDARMIGRARASADFSRQGKFRRGLSRLKAERSECSIYKVDREQERTIGRVSRCLKPIL